MHEKKLQRLAESLASVSAKAIGGFRPDQGRAIVTDGWAYTLLVEQGRELNRVLKELLIDEGWSDRFSEEYLGKQLRGIVANTEDAQSASQHLVKLEQDYLNWSAVQTVYVPVCGLVLKVPLVRLGNVVFQPFTRDTCAEALRQTRAIIDTTRYTEQEKQTLMQRWEDDFAEHFTDKVFAVYEATAEPTRAMERAEEETLRAIDIIRWLVSESYPVSHNVQVGLPGAVVDRTIKRTFCASGENVTFGQKAAGPLQSCVLSEERLKMMNEMGASAFSDMLAKPPRSLSDFERTLLRALHWFSNSRTMHELENRFLNLVTCIETLFNPRGRGPISASIAEGVALLLGQTFEERKRLKNLLKELYDKRSQISHNGHQVVLKSDYEVLEQLASDTLQRLVAMRQQFGSQKDLLEWIEDRKLGRPNQTDDANPHESKQS